jgi:dihydrofolate reductase
MRKVVVSHFVTLDGVMEDPGAQDKFKDADWHFRFWNEEVRKFKVDELFAADALLLGRVTYEVYADAWPGRTDEDGFADHINKMPKYVVSTTLSQLKWNNSQLIKGNLVEEVEKLKQQPWLDILVGGGGRLVRSLMQYDLVDEYRLMVHPIVVGNGMRLFQDAKSTPLRLAETKTFSTGVVVLTYQRVV